MPHSIPWELPLEWLSQDLKVNKNEITYVIRNWFRIVEIIFNTKKKTPNILSVFYMTAGRDVNLTVLT